MTMVPRCGVDVSNVSNTPLAKDMGAALPVSWFSRSNGVSFRSLLISTRINEDDNVTFSNDICSCPINLHLQGTFR